MCDCKSYNKPEWGGSKPEVIVPKPEWADRTSDTICLDSCIAEDVQTLWANGIHTLGSCCGHNQAPPSIVVESKSDPEYIRFIKSLVPGWEINQWELVRK